MSRPWPSYLNMPPTTTPSGRSRGSSKRGQEYTYDSFKHKCLELSHRFNRFGISARDKVAILSNNMPNWTVAMFSCVPFGRVTVPILPDSSESEVTNIINHSECKAIFVSKRLLKKLSQEVIDKLTLVIDIETFDFIKKRRQGFHLRSVTVLIHRPTILRQSSTHQALPERPKA